MITKNDCLSILVKMEDSGINIDQYMKKLLVAKEVPLDVLKFISDNRGIEVAKFYEVIRKNHNAKKSPLYTNIVKDITDTNEVLTTLTCLLTQALLFAKKSEHKEVFLREVRAEEISRVLNEYFKTYDPTNCMKLLKLVKSDLLVLEYIAGRRELTA